MTSTSFMKIAMGVGAGALTACLAACIADTTPIPEDREGENTNNDGESDVPPDGSGMWSFDSSRIFYSDVPIVLVGLPRAAPAECLVVATNTSRAGVSGTTIASPDGSFGMPLNAASGEVVELQLLWHETQLSTMTIAIQSPSDAARVATAEMGAGAGEDMNPTDSTYGFITASTPDEAGMVTIAGPAGTVIGGDGTAAALSVIASNMTQSAATTAPVLSDGSFTVSVPGQTGDELRLFVVANGAASGGAPATLFVP